MEISVVYTDENQVMKKVKALTSVVGEWRQTFSMIVPDFCLELIVKRDTTLQTG
jgi:hypothetical protein